MGSFPRWEKLNDNPNDNLNANNRNTSKYETLERGLYYNWIKHNKKLLKAGRMKEERVEMFEKLLARMEEGKSVEVYIVKDNDNYRWYGFLQEDS